MCWDGVPNETSFLGVWNESSRIFYLLARFRCKKRIREKSRSNYFRIRSVASIPISFMRALPSMVWSIRFPANEQQETAEHRRNKLLNFSLMAFTICNSDVSGEEFGGISLGASTTSAGKTLARNLQSEEQKIRISTNRFHA